MHTHKAILMLSIMKLLITTTLPFIGPFNLHFFQPFQTRESNSTTQKKTSEKKKRKKTVMMPVEYLSNVCKKFYLY